ncbi:unknown protein [Seminavis robusta]|uniref:Uncharacterized protein n=1 Tax=Seminavis robusta TaxID=568900 RepID=A0A9N8HXD2_9STRA|nr:unknown protein [Seminavis robusta]|eukprot:Sro3040_g112661.1  (124) ;mRNA; r:4373-4744
MHFILFVHETYDIDCSSVLGVWLVVEMWMMLSALFCSATVFSASMMSPFAPITFTAPHLFLISLLTLRFFSKSSLLDLVSLKMIWGPLKGCFLRISVTLFKSFSPTNMDNVSDLVVPQRTVVR